jgi:hypothetical protein
MILYKYRSLANFERILDIILNQRLYCSAYHELNDPFEGIYRTTRLCLEGDGISTKRDYENAKDLGGDEIKICSLSSDLKDVRLWSYYADGHKGVVFKIDFSGLKTRDDTKILHEVKYSEELPWGSTIPSRQISRQEVLSRKTKYWEFESEYRIIDESKYLNEDKYFDIKGRITAIYLGTRTSPIHRELLNKIVPGDIPIYMTDLNKKTIEVEPGECIPERKVSP